MSPIDLRGLRVVVTRSERQRGSLVASVTEAGGEVIGLPMLEIREPVDGGSALRAALETLESEDWLVALSPNAAKRIVESGFAAETCRLAVVADGTARVFTEQGLRPDLIPAVPTSEGLLTALGELPAQESTELSGPAVSAPGVVIVQAKDGLSTLADGLRDLGWRVVVVEAYVNVTPALDADAVMSARTRSDVVVFASPSAVERYLEVVGPVPNDAVCIGSVTGSRARERGFNVRIAVTPTVESMLAELERFAQS